MSSSDAKMMENTFSQASEDQENNILIILAHKNSTQRNKMVQSGITPVLLEVALLGSSLAQERARKLLQWFRYERQIKMGQHSGPQSTRIGQIIPTP